MFRASPRNIESCQPAHVDITCDFIIAFYIRPRFSVTASCKQAFTSALPDVSAPEPEQTLLQMDAAEGTRRK